MPVAGPSRVLIVLRTHTERPWTASPVLTPPAAGSALQWSLDGGVRHSRGAGVLRVQVPVLAHGGKGEPGAACEHACRQPKQAWPPGRSRSA